MIFFNPLLLFLQELEDSEFYQTGEPTEEEEPEGDPCSLLGSVGSLYGGESQLLYNQFELNSPVVRKHQMLLLQVCCHTRIGLANFTVASLGLCV